MVKGCGKNLLGAKDVVYLEADGSFHITWREAIGRDSRDWPSDRDFPFEGRYCGSDGHIDGKRQHICMECAKSLGVIW